MVYGQDSPTSQLEITRNIRERAANEARLLSNQQDFGHQDKFASRRYKIPDAP